MNDKVKQLSAVAVAEQAKDKDVFDYYDGTKVTVSLEKKGAVKELRFIPSYPPTHPGLSKGDFIKRFDFKYFTKSGEQAVAGDNK